MTPENLKANIYYPTPKETSVKHQDFLWAQDREHFITGLQKFFADIIPETFIYYLTSIRMGVRVNADIIKKQG